jgi:excisionase family DNA binding protein
MPPGAVLLDPAEAADVVRALDLLADVLGKLRDERGNRTPSAPSPRLVAITDKLRKASRTADDSPPSDSGNVRVFAPQHIPVDSRGHAAVMGTGAAARTLGVTPGAVRDLARRGRIPAAYTGTRWQFDAAAVVHLAEYRAQKRAERGR